MKKQIIITLEVESDDEYCMMDSFIKDDLATEISCCSNFYEIKDIRFETDIQKMQHLEQAQLDKAYELGKEEQVNKRA